jgi:cell division septation protein DedD
LAAIAYYLPWYEFDSIQSGEKRYPLRIHRLTGEVNYFDGQSWKKPPIPGMVSAKAISPEEKSASVQIKPTLDEPKLTSSLPPQKEDGEGSPTISSAPPVSPDLSNAEKESPVPSAIPPKETQAVKAKDGEKPEKGERIAEEPAPPKKMEPPPKKDFFAVKIMALRDPQKAQEFMDSQKKKGFDIHSRTITIKDRGIWQRIFLGHFESQEEAKRFLDEKKIRQSYPGSVIMKLTR